MTTTFALPPRSSYAERVKRFETRVGMNPLPQPHISAADAAVLIPTALVLVTALVVCGSITQAH